MKKSDGGHYETKEVWIKDKEKCYCDQCSMFVDDKEIKQFSLMPEINYDLDIHFCSYECLEQWINGDSKELKRLTMALEHAEPIDRTICVAVEGISGLRKLFEAW